MNNEIVITNHNPQDITITEQDNQLIFVNGGGDVIGITDVKVNGTSVVTNNIAYVIVPTKTSDLINDSGYITTETDPTIPAVVKEITLADINNWNSKQNTLVSGSTIKTVNNESLLGSGNINITGTQYSAGNGIDITNDIISNTITSYNDLTDLPTIPTNTSDLINDSDFVSENQLADVAFDGSYTSLSNTPTIPDSTSQLVNDSNFIDSTQLSTELATKQNTLVSGTNIKTINGVSILGAGDIVVTGGSATEVQINGTSITSGGIANIITESAYNSSSNKIATMNDLNNLFESGTFTPTIKGSTIAGTSTYSLQQGFYFKIGNILIYDFKIGIDSISGASGFLQIDGIPFNNIGTSASLGNVICSGSLFGNDTVRLLWNGEGIIFTNNNNGLGGLSISDTNTTNYIYATGIIFES